MKKKGWYWHWTKYWLMLDWYQMDINIIFVYQSMDRQTNVSWAQSLSITWKHESFRGRLSTFPVCSVGSITLCWTTIKLVLSQLCLWELLLWKKRQWKEKTIALGGKPEWKDKRGCIKLRWKQKRTGTASQYKQECV